MQITFPKIAKYLALFVFLSSSIYLVTFLVRRGASKPPPPLASKTLGKDLTMVSNNFRYVQTKSGVNKLILTAEREVAFIDDRHTLEGVKLETFEDDGKPSGVLTAGSCDYDQKNNKAQFKSGVVITTASGLTVKTERLDYDQEAELAVTDMPVTFNRENINGTCVGMKLDGKASHLTMERAVNVTVASAPPKPGAQLVKSGLVNGASSYTITGGRGEYLKLEKRVVLIGDARLLRGGDEMKADRMTGFLDDRQNLQRLEARSNALLKSNEKSGQVTSRDMDIFFDAEGNATQAVAIGDGSLKTIGDGPGREVFGDRIEAQFAKGAVGSEIVEVKVLGNARVKILAPPPTPQAPQPAERELTSNSATIRFYPGGRFAQSATAEGDAVFTVTPVVVEPRADRKRLRAPRMDAAFYETDNQFKNCVAQGGVEMELTPLEANAMRPPKKTTSATARAEFERASSDATEIVQEGNVMFNEGVRNGVAERASYNRIQEKVYLRGNKRPLLYDDKARIEAREIDVSTVSAEHFARGDVRVTYYNPESAGGGVFKKSKSPVFVTSNAAQGDSATGKAVYTGEARCWQEDNFVRGDRIEMFQKDRRLAAFGKVSTALYQIERSVVSGRKQVVPMFGTSEDFEYSDSGRRAHYQGNVKLTQGEESLAAEATDVFLDAKSNRVERMTASKKVVLVQPNRRGVGDAAEYTAASDRYVLTGNMARIEDAEQGDSTGPQLIFTKSNDTVRAVDQSRSRRIRSTHKVQ